MKGIRLQHPVGGKTLRYRRLLSGVSFVVLTLAGIALPGNAFAGENDYSATITVLVHNYSQASPTILARAEREAGRIIGEAGLRTLWLECPTGPSTADPNVLCQRAAEATDIRLRVLAAPVQKYEDTVFGFTVHPVLATVYYEYAVRRAKSDHAEFEIPIILGCVISHELGHLLLGSNGHSGAGIMRPRWEPRHVRQLLMGTVRFTTEQAMLMRAQARTRMRVQAASLKEYRNIMVEHRAGPASDSAE